LRWPTQEIELSGCRVNNTAVMAGATRQGPGRESISDAPGRPSVGLRSGA
jgi:hypothetical protein